MGDLNMFIDDVDLDALSKEKTEFELIPAQWAPAMAEEVKVEDDKAKPWSRVTFKFCILDGEFANRRVWTKIFLRHDGSPKALHFSQVLMAKFGVALGLTTQGERGESTNYLNKPVLIHIVIDPEKDGYKARNNINDYKAIGDEPVAAKPVQEAQKAPAAATPSQNKSNMPWMKK
jgi:hypothetical protein